MFTSPLRILSDIAAPKESSKTEHSEKSRSTKKRWDYLYDWWLLFVVSVTQGKAYVPLSLRTSVRLGMGGFCTRRGGCNTISPLVSTAKQCWYFSVLASQCNAIRPLVNTANQCHRFRLPRLHCNFKWD